MAKRQALVWPPKYDGQSQRVKGFYPEVISCSNAPVLVDRLGELRLHPQATRILLRVAIERRALEELHGNCEGFSLEAAFPIDHIFPSCSVAYLGLNKHERADNGATTTVQLKQLEILQREYGMVQRPELEAQTRRYRIVHVLGMNDRTAEKIAAIFRGRFKTYPIELSPESIRRMPDDHVVTVAYAGEDISAVFMADMASIDINGKKLTFFDFVNVLSIQDGLYLIPLMAHYVMDIAKRYPNPIVYAEARADVPGLQICCIRAGMMHVGTLRSSSIFQDQHDTSPSYRNTHVWYVPR